LFNFRKKNPIKNLAIKIKTVLKKYQNEPLDRYFIAKIEVKKFENQASGIVYKSISNQSNSAIITDKLSDFQSLTVILIKSECSSVLAKKIEFDKNLFYKKSFSETELNNFLKLSGDKNPIHFGEKAVVPGLLILSAGLCEQNFLEEISQEASFFTIKFQNPLHLQQELKVYKITENEAIGIFENQVIFKIKFKK
jgi:hypothetical protein